MKKLFFAIALSAVTACMAQEESKHTIERVDATESAFSKTDITWDSQKEIVEWNKKTAEEEMWSAQDKKEADIYAKASPGGQLMLTIKRASIDAANTEWFTVIVKKGATEIYRIALKSKIPETPGSDRLWTNYKSISIKKAVAPPFDVYVIDGLAKPPKYQFRVVN